MAKKKNNKFIVVMVFFAAILAVFLLVGDVRQEVQGYVINFAKKPTEILSNSGQVLKRRITFIAKMRQIKKQNDELSSQLMQTEIDKNYIKELETENKILKKELGYLENSMETELIPAKIIQRDSISFSDNIIIDKGLDDGVLAKKAVICSGAMVGQVQEVYSNSAKVVLITSKDSIVQAMLQNSRSKGILRGGLSGLFLEDIVFDTDFDEGENVVTSGLGGTIKEGILIGKAGKSQNQGSGIFKSISVEPVVDFSKLELVFIQK